MEKWIESKRVYEGKIVSVRAGSVLLDERTAAFREVVEHPGGVTVVPVWNNSVVLVRQFRIAVGCDVLETPAGKLEPGDSPLARAHIELEEETGYRAERMISVGSIFATVGYSSEEIHLFLAFDLEPVGKKPEFDESIETEELPISEIEPRIASGQIKDAKTIVALHALLHYLRQNGKRPEEL